MAIGDATLCHILLGRQVRRVATARPAARLAVVLLAFLAWPASTAFAGPDPCSIDSSGMIATCSGNQSAGISYVDQTLTTINVQNLTAPIAPVVGPPGVALGIQRPAAPPRGPAGGPP